MINLLPPDYVKRYSLDKKELIFGLVVSSLIIILVITGSYYLGLVSENKIINAKLNLVEKKLLKVNRKASGLKELEGKVKSLEKSIKKQEDVLGKEIRWSFVLIELQRVITDKSWIEDFKVTKDHLFSLTGYTIEQKDLGVIVNQLKRSPYFDKVFVNLTQQKSLSKEGYKSKVLLMYQISGELIGNSGDNDGLVE